MRNYTWIALLGFIVGAALFLLKEYQPYILDILPWVLLLLCPVLHLFMHRGHGRHGVHGGQGDQGGGGVSPGSHDMDKGQVGEKGA